MQTYITICHVERRRELGVCVSGNSDRGSVSTQRGCDGEGGWGEVQKGGDACIPVADSCRGLFARNRRNSVKQLSLSLKIN